MSVSGVPPGRVAMKILPLRSSMRLMSLRAMITHGKPINGEAIILASAPAAKLGMIASAVQ